MIDFTSPKKQALSSEFDMKLEMKPETTNQFMWEGKEEEWPLILNGGEIKNVKLMNGINSQSIMVFQDLKPQTEWREEHLRPFGDYNSFNQFLQTQLQNYHIQWDETNQFATEEIAKIKNLQAFEVLFLFLFFFCFFLVLFVGFFNCENKRKKK